MARKYHVEGTKSYLWSALIMFVVSLWFIWDGWFPREAVLAAHPNLTHSFYAFNKCTGVILLVGSVIAGYIHSVVK